MTRRVFKILLVSFFIWCNKLFICAFIIQTHKLIMPMNKKYTADSIVKEKKEMLSPKDSTITFLMNFARVYCCDNKHMTSTGGYILN